MADYKPARLTTTQRIKCARVALSLGVSVSSVERCMRYHAAYLAPTERNQQICDALSVTPPWGDGTNERATVETMFGDKPFTRRYTRIRYAISVVIITGHAVPTKRGKWVLK